MADLADLEKRLNHDHQLRNEFLQDPVVVLKREGLTLSPQQENSLVNAVKQALTSQPAAAGSSVSPQAKNVGVGVVVIVKF